MRRPLRRSRHVYYSTVPVVDDSYGIEPSANDPEVVSLRDRERSIQNNNAVADFCVYHFQSARQIDNALKMRLYDMAISRFRDRLPPEMIRALVDATIRQEVGLREQTARWRRAEAARKAERQERQRAVN